jgi:hypothetical protein
MAPLTFVLTLALASPAADMARGDVATSSADRTPVAADDRDHASSAVATVFAQPYADSGDALEVCCAAAACTFVGINECSLLTPEGKILAMMSAAVGGLGGFMGGVGTGVALWIAIDTGIPAGTPLDPYKGDLLLTMAFLSGAVGIVVGGIGGAAAAFVADAIFLQGPPPPPRRRYYYSEEIPPPAGEDAASVGAF